MIIRKLSFILFLCGLFYRGINSVSAQSVELVQQQQDCSIRGLSVVDNKIAWASGSKGHVAITHNSGKTWLWQQVKGFEQSDFRDVEAFSSREAIIMSSGTPALVLKTINGGSTWNVVFRHDDKAWFLDEMTFVGKERGYILGDPIDGKFVLLKTKNRGGSWQSVVDLPIAMPGEAAFAASGTGIIQEPRSRNFYFVTGGKVSRIFSCIEGNFHVEPIPLKQGLESQGAFSVAAGGARIVVVGGDYKHPKNRDSVACFYDSKKGKNSYKNIRLSNTQPKGFQSSAIFLGKNTFLSTGTSGTNLSYDGGETWKQIDTASYNVCQKAKQGNLIILAGDKGRIALLKM